MTGPSPDSNGSFPRRGQIHADQFLSMNRIVKRSFVGIPFPLSPKIRFTLGEALTLPLENDSFVSNGFPSIIEMASPGPIFG